MELRSYTNTKDFRDLVFPFLCQNEAQNCLGLGIITTLIEQPATYSKFYLWAAIEKGEVKGVAWWTPPHPIGMSDFPVEAFELFIDEINKLPEVPNIFVGPKPTADAFAKAWGARKNLSIQHTIHQRIFRLEKIIPPLSTKGEMRLVNENDHSLLEVWSAAFVRDCGMGDGSGADKIATAAINTKSRYLWLVDGKPVSMAGASGPTPSGIRINWVYTPPELRGHGYASQVVAALSQKMLDEGRSFCFLYTDLGNPTSNSIYQKIGYQAVCDAAYHNFSSNP